MLQHKIFLSTAFIYTSKFQINFRQFFYWFRGADSFIGEVA